MWRRSVVAASLYATATVLTAGKTASEGQVWRHVRVSVSDFLLVCQKPFVVSLENVKGQVDLFERFASEVDRSGKHYMQVEEVLRAMALNTSTDPVLTSKVSVGY